jgi:CcmD family protein
MTLFLAALVVWGIIVGYLYWMDRRVSKLEKK